jgi:demethylmenaquinone methyltransferase/2-methoxy-6-polyprenyl-1,4-benzoquinol methylase
MATILRDWSYQYPWLYQGISSTLALAVGGNARLRELPLEGLPIAGDSRVLDCCCGRGEATRFLVKYSQHVIGLDASPKALAVARQAVPEANYVEAFAQAMPFDNHTFDIVHISMALHELSLDSLQAALSEIYRVLKPQGILTLVDFHAPRISVMWPGMALFLWLFETETAWAFLNDNLIQRLNTIGFGSCIQTWYVGGSLQRIQAHKA